MESQTVQIKFVPAFLPFYREKARFKFAWGGRGGSKSISFADIFELIARENRNQRILCCREIQKSINESVHTLLEDRINLHGFDDFNVQKTNINNKVSNSEFIFTGLREHNVDSIKSYQGINYCWVEEAHMVMQKSLDILIPTIREGRSEVWFSYNRDAILDPVHKLALRELKESKKMRYIWNDGQIIEWVEYRGPDAIGVFINYDGNPYFPDVLKKEMEKDKEENYNLYLHKWLGHPQPEGGDILIGPEIVMKAINRPVGEWNKLAIGVDPARYGDDESVVCHRIGYKIQPLKTFKGINTMQLSGMVINLAKQLYKISKEPITVKVDDTGIGSGVTDRLEELQDDEHRKAPVDQTFNIDIIPIVNNGTATDNDYYDYGAEMWGEMKKALKTISIPDDDELINQLTTRKYKIHSDGRIRLEKKEDMKKRGLHSPDRADALALCLAEGYTPHYGDDDIPEMGR